VAANAAERRNADVVIPAKRGDQAPAKEDIANEVAAFAQAHAGQKPTADQVRLAQEAAEHYGNDWCGDGRQYDWSANAQWTYGQQFYCECYNRYPQQYDTWRGIYNNGNIDSFNGILNGNNFCLAFC
jgi:phenylpyruvate tautomerase PptA (4-oxalocrotonate tautomerase family)